MARRALFVLVAALVFIGAGSVAGAAAAPRRRPTLLPPPGPTCPAALIMGARGSGESFRGFDGMGPSVDRMAQDLRAWLAKAGAGTQTLANPYPAISTNVLKPSRATILLIIAAPPIGLAHYLSHNVHPFLRSIDEGIDTEVQQADDEVSDCPATKLVMAGYSQGAMVIHQAELRLQSSHRRTFRHIVGTLLLADGDRVANSRAHRFGSALARGEGIRPYLHAVRRRDVPLPGSTGNICKAGDLICDFNLHSVRHAGDAVKIHTSYARKTAHGYRYSPLLDRGANWLGRKLALKVL
jgi:hypothetical protein